MPTPAESIAQFQSDTDLLHTWLHGDVNTTIVTDSGVLPSLAAIIAGMAFTPVLQAKAACAAILPAHTYAAGVMTATANGAFPAIDGIAFGVGDFFLWWDSSGHGGGNLEYWIYRLGDAGSAGTPWIATRPSFADGASELSAVSTYVMQGNTLAGRRFALPYNPAVVVGTTVLRPVIIG